MNVMFITIALLNKRFNENYAKNVHLGMLYYIKVTCLRIGIMFRSYRSLHPGTLDLKADEHTTAPSRLA